MSTFAAGAFTSGAGAAIGAASLTGAGVGATSAGAGAGAMAGFSAAMPYFAVAAAFIGGVAGTVAAGRHNADLRKIAIAKYKQLNDLIEQNRISYYDATRIASSQAAGDLSQLELAMSGFGSGLSNNEYIAQVQADKESDQATRLRQQTLTEQNLNLEKENVYNTARSQTVSPAMGALQGALSYGQIGASIGGFVDSYRLDAANNSALTQIANDYAANPNDPITLARISAVGAGAAPYRVMGDSNPYLSPFLAGQQQQSIESQILKNQANLSDLQLQAVRQMYSRQLNLIGQYPNTQPSQGLLDLIRRN